MKKLFGFVLICTIVFALIPGCAIESQNPAGDLPEASATLEPTVIPEPTKDYLSFDEAIDICEKRNPVYTSYVIPVKDIITESSYAELEWYEDKDIAIIKMYAVEDGDVESDIFIYIDKANDTSYFVDTNAKKLIPEDGYSKNNIPLNVRYLDHMNSEPVSGKMAVDSVEYDTLDYTVAEGITLKFLRADDKIKSLYIVRGDFEEMYEYEDLVISSSIPEGSALEGVKDYVIDPLGYIVKSESMAPTFELNDICYFEAVDPSQLVVGDIVLVIMKYGDEIADGNYKMAHRIIRIEEENGIRKYILKGDNNFAEDNGNYYDADILGKLID